MIFIPGPPILPNCRNMTLGVRQQGLAITAAIKHPGNAAAAGQWLVQQCHEQKLDPPENPRQYVLRWMDRGTPSGGIISYASRSGRKQMLKPRQVETAYQRIIHFEKDGLERPWKNANDIARDCPVVRKLLQVTGASMGTLLAKIKERHPRFGLHKLRARWGMTPQVQQDRLSKAELLKAEYADKLDNAVFFDAKTVYLQETTLYGYVDLDVGYTMSRSVVAKKQGKVIRLKYYAAVNAKLGPFFIIYYTGTTDMPAKRGRLHYKVWLSAEQFRCTLSKHML